MTFTSDVRIAVLVLAGTAALWAAESSDFLIARGHAGKLALQMPEAEIYKRYPRTQTRKVDLQLEGNPTPAVEIYLSRPAGEPAMVATVTLPGDRIRSIQIKDPRFHDEAGIHVGSSFGQLRRAHGSIEIAAGEGECWAALEKDGLSFRLAIDDQTEGEIERSHPGSAAESLSRIPDNTPILAISVFTDPGYVQ